MDKTGVEVPDHSGMPTIAPSPEAKKQPHNPEIEWPRHIPLRVAIFSAVLLPFVLAPYLLMRRRALTLKHEVDKLRNTTRAAQLELDAAQAQLSKTKSEVQDTKRVLYNVMAEADTARHRIAGLSARSDACRVDLDRLLVESRNSRTQIAALKALGSSLADVAAFMDEVELQMGLQPLSGHAQRRVDRLRVAAFRLQNLPQSATSGGSEQPSHEGSPSTKAAENA